MVDTKPNLVNKLLFPKKIIHISNNRSEIVSNAISNVISESVNTISYATDIVKNKISDTTVNIKDVLYENIYIPKSVFTTTFVVNFTFCAVLILSAIWIYNIYIERKNEKKTPIKDIEDFYSNENITNLPYVDTNVFYPDFSY